MEPDEGVVHRDRRSFGDRALTHHADFSNHMRLLPGAESRLARVNRIPTFRMPANDSLEQNIAELLPDPVGRPSHKPVVRYEGFL